MSSHSCEDICDSPDHGNSPECVLLWCLIKVFFLCDRIPSNSFMKAIEGVIKGYLSPFFFFFGCTGQKKKKSEEPHIWRITVFCDYPYVRGGQYSEHRFFYSYVVSFFFLRAFTARIRCVCHENILLLKIVAVIKEKQVTVTGIIS